MEWFNNIKHCKILSHHITPDLASLALLLPTMLFEILADDLVTSCLFATHSCEGEFACEWRALSDQNIALLQSVQFHFDFVKESMQEIEAHFRLPLSLVWTDAQQITDVVVFRLVEHNCLG